jgi:hypothetical protein
MAYLCWDADEPKSASPIPITASSFAHAAEIYAQRRYRGRLHERFRIAVDAESGDPVRTFAVKVEVAQIVFVSSEVPHTEVPHG